MFLYERHILSTNLWRRVLPERLRTRLADVFLSIIWHRFGSHFGTLLPHHSVEPVAATVGGWQSSVEPVCAHACLLEISVDLVGGISRTSSLICFYNSNWSLFCVFYEISRLLSKAYFIVWVRSSKGKRNLAELWGRSNREITYISTLGG